MFFGFFTFFFNEAHKLFQEPNIYIFLNIMVKNILKLKKNQSFVNFEILTIFGELITVVILSACNVRHAFYTKV